MELPFKIASGPKDLPEEGRLEAWLLSDNWDDWGKFETLYHLFVFDASGKKTRIGDVKIGKRGLAPGVRDLKNIKEDVRFTPVPGAFFELDSSFFSVGQDASYYQELMGLEAGLRKAILMALRDVVADAKLWESVRDEEVTQRSLLRFVTPKTVEGQFRRILEGGAVVIPFTLVYTPATKLPTPEEGGLSFVVEPDSQPPTNLHVLIGKNGVGKSFTLHHMAKSLLIGGKNSEVTGSFRSGQLNEPEPIANLVSVSFSAFDSFEQLSPPVPTLRPFRYHYVGLKGPAGETKSSSTLGAEFVESLHACTREPKSFLWRRVLAPLESDPLFKDAQISKLLSARKSPSLRVAALELFEGLSSGHKIVLLTLTRLVEVVEERTLVLLDEPESHLHPPLLSAFVRAASWLLTHRNAVAIVATHSPVVLQEVPLRCVWVLNRSGNVSDARRPEIETFGENVGTLTREVFKLEVARAGFQILLKDVAAKSASLEEALAQFDGQLGEEARASLRAIFATRQSSNEKS
ncbi:MAG: AAA family ATPase [Verrucomicrobia bacterium]|nr:AAA family ATPase [Verrucomicrobiota bacterium]